MRLKYYLRGAGVGVLVTALIFTIVIALNGKTSYTEEEIAAEAEALGMVWPEDLIDEADSSDSSDGSDGTAADDDDADSDGSTSAADSTESGLVTVEGISDEEAQALESSSGDADSSTSGSTSSDDDTDSTTEVVDKSNYVEVEIKSGESSAAVCQKLEDAGLVDDATAFDAYLAEQGLDGKIVVGSYAIPKDLTYYSLSRVITNQ